VRKVPSKFDQVGGRDLHHQPGQPPVHQVEHVLRLGAGRLAEHTEHGEPRGAERA
jgi:hypothetical protein